MRAMRATTRTLAILGAAAALGWGLGAGDDAVKIGVVDMEQAISSTEEGRAAREELERKKRDAEAQLQPMYEQFKQMREEMESKQFVLSEDALRQKRLDLAELGNQIQNRQKELEGKLQIDGERLVGPLQKKLMSIVEDIGRKEGFTLIIARGTPGVMYTREALDITDLVVEKFNRKG
jgi:outer membrane protein